MNKQEQLNLWTKLCLKGNLTPICLITYDKDGYPHVFTDYEADQIQQVLKHLVKNNPIEDNFITPWTNKN